MAIDYKMKFTRDVTLQDGVTLNDGTTVVNGYILRVRGVLIGEDEERGISASLDLHVDAANPDQKPPSDFVEIDDLLTIPENLKQALIAEGQTSESRNQIEQTLDAISVQPYGDSARWPEVEEDID